MNALRFGLACALVAASLSSHGVVIVADKYEVGDQGVLFDTSTGLDWARGPTGLTGGNYAGFRLASSEEVSTLFNDVGLGDAFLFGYYSGIYWADEPIPPFDSVPGPYRPAFDVLWSVWRPASEGNISRSTTVQVFQVAPRSELPFSFGQLSLSYIPGLMEFFASAHEYDDSTPPPGGAGRALVRVHVDVIPEPETYALMLFGLASLALAVRRRKRGARYDRD